MNKLIHDIINKFNAINLMCGTMALEIETNDKMKIQTLQLKDKIFHLIENIDGDIAAARQMLREVTGAVSGKLNHQKESEHFFEVIEPGIATIEKKRQELRQAIIRSGIGVREVPLSTKDITVLLHAIEEKALACGMVMKELRSSLIKAGKYDSRDG